MDKAECKHGEILIDYNVYSGKEYNCRCALCGMKLDVKIKMTVSKKYVGMPNPNIVIMPKVTRKNEGLYD